MNADTKSAMAILPRRHGVIDACSGTFYSLRDQRQGKRLICNELAPLNRQRGTVDRLIDLREHFVDARAGREVFRSASVRKALRTFVENRQTPYHLAMAKVPTQSPAKTSPVERIESRHIREFIRIRLFVKAGGRCEFDGCNKQLLEHPITLNAGNFAQMAHIVAFKVAGPRGAEGERPLDINSVENLMLLCPDCHKQVDDDPDGYPRARLEGFKHEHEERIARLTELGPNRKTAVLVLKAPVGGHAVAIPDDHIFEAVLPRYPMSRAGTVIDLNALGGPRENASFYDQARAQVDRAVERLFAPGGEAERTGHISVLGIGPIPLLVHLGAQLTNKVAADFHQRHRDTENWTWKPDGDRVEYGFGLRQAGRDGGPIVLVLELSGTISTDALPAEFQDGAWIYRLGLEGRVPDPTFLRRREDLDGFRVAYQQVLGLIGHSHGPIENLDLFPAVPAPVAILCGRERLSKFHPRLRVYDYDNNRGGYVFALNVE